MGRSGEKGDPVYRWIPCRCDSNTTHCMTPFMTLHVGRVPLNQDYSTFSSIQLGIICAAMNIDYIHKDSSIYHVPYIVKSSRINSYSRVLIHGLKISLPPYCLYNANSWKYLCVTAQPQPNIAQCWNYLQGILVKWKQQAYIYTLEKSALDDSSAYIYLPY